MPVQVKSKLSTTVKSKQKRTIPALNFTEFDAIGIKVASPEKILLWSHGEIKKPETINYRSFRPERDGLFCERIFGPVRDWECSCGKYKYIKHKGIVCDRCNVEVTESKVRRERMGHIELAVPVAHPWFVHKTPSRIGTLLDIRPTDLEMILYYARYVILKDFRDQYGSIVKYTEYFVEYLEDTRRIEEQKRPVAVSLKDSHGAYLKIHVKDDRFARVTQEDKGNPIGLDFIPDGKGRAPRKIEPRGFDLSARTLLNEEQYRDCRLLNEGIEIDIGAGAIRNLLSSLDLNKEEQSIRQKLASTKSETETSRNLKRLRLVNAFRYSTNKPEWMILTVLPVLPPDLRPLVPLEGGRFASSDLNDLYRRIINRNNRLKHMITLRAPEVMIHNEKRLLQEAVDALIENGIRNKIVTGSGGRPLKSFSDILKGKQGRFRQNLLGKRVDYSGRSVIVAGPELKLHQCGLPKEMALEMFKPFILRELVQKENVTLKAAKRMLDRGSNEVWDILESITKRHLVLLNRAPTLHRLSIQAFEPVLTEGKALQLHPLTCAAFNADFDGDQMAVHIPLSLEAQREAELLLWAPYNIISPASGRPLAICSQDMVLGCAYLTKEKIGDLGEGKIFFSEEEVITAYQHQQISLNARIKVNGRNKLREPNLSESEQKNPSLWKDYTTAGRIIFNQVIPLELRFVNNLVTKKNLTVLVEDCYRKLGLAKTVAMLDDLKKLGFHYSTLAGLSISIADMKIPPAKRELIDLALKQVREIQRQAKDGIITDLERYNKIVDLWARITEKVAENLFAEMAKDDVVSYRSGKSKFNTVLMMTSSGARGSAEQVRQLCGMRGLMTRPARKLTGAMGEIVESPVISNFREGLTVLEYFISAHGGRKGLADTALKTADAGYLTRRLVDVAHDVTISMDNCGTVNGVRVTALRSGDETIESLEERLVGRVAMENGICLLPNEQEERLVIKRGDIITAEQAKLFAKYASLGKDALRIRSILTCEAPHGICAKCYGANLTTGRLVDVGEAVGIVAAQSIGEPGTQLTLRTFHIGGTAARVVKHASARSLREGSITFHNCRQELLVKDRSGVVMNLNRNMEIGIREVARGEGPIKDYHKIPYGARIRVKEGQKIESGRELADWDPYSLPIIAEYSGLAKLEDVAENKTLQVEKNRVTGLVERRIIEHRLEHLTPRVEIIDTDRMDHLSAVLKKISVGKKGQLSDRLSTLIKLVDNVLKILKPAQIDRDKLSADYHKLTKILRSLIEEKEKELITEEKDQLKQAFPPTYILPVDTRLMIKDLDKVEVGDVLAKTPLEVTKTKDITGGLPRVVELFEARRPKNPAIISEIEGKVQIVTTAKGTLKLRITDEEAGITREYLIPGEKHLVVREGDFVSAGEPLTDGAVNPHDILRIKQVRGVQEYLVNEIQEVYRLQGVMVNDKHIEVIVRQMLSFVKVANSGDTYLLPGEIVKRTIFDEENNKVEKNKGKKADARPILLGLIRASLYSSSFISAASFQETTRVLTDSAIEEQMDYLTGLKENVIIGHLIPAGTGFPAYR